MDEAVAEDRTEQAEAYPRVAIVILNWNGWRDTLECLESLQKVAYPNFEVVVVDNGSTDGSVGIVAQRFPDLPVIEVGENLGFPGGCNVGIGWALNRDAEYVLLLNPDTVADPGILTAMVEAAETANAAVVGAVVRSPSGRLLFARREYPLSLFLGRRLGLPDGVGPVWSSDEADACAIMLDKRLLLDRKATLGYYLDPSLFLYCEEIELCHFARSRGYRVVITGATEVVHKVGTSSGGGASPLSYYYLTRNRVVLARRLLPWWLQIVFNVYFPASRLLLVGWKWLKGYPESARSIMKGLFAGYGARS